MFFAFELAEQLGMTVDSMLSGMTSDEFSRWKAFYRIKKKMHDKEELRRKAEAKLANR